MEIKKQNRNNSIDVFKSILLIFILTAHALPKEIPKSGDTIGAMFCIYLNSFSRLVVPIFFILTGYFLRNRLLDKVYIIKYLKRLIILFIVWQLIYLKFHLTSFQSNMLSLENFGLGLFWGIAHLWYLNATILAVLFVFLIRNFTTKTKFFTAFVLLFACFFLQTVTKLQTVYDVDQFKLISNYFGTERNFFFYGIPYILFGTLYENWKNHIKKINYLLFPLVFLLFLECFFYVHFFSKTTLNIFVTALPISFILVNKVIEGNFKTTLKVNPTLPIGIYLCHFYPIYYVFSKFPFVPIEHEIFKFLLISGLTIVFWFIIDKINKKFPYFF